MEKWLVVMLLPYPHQNLKSAYAFKHATFEVFWDGLNREERVGEKMFFFPP